MRLGIVSDTHGEMRFARPAIDLLETLNVDLVIHCGDIGNESMIPLFDRWPAHFVFGNVDGDGQRLRTAIEAAGQTCHEMFGSLTCEGKKIAFLHSHDAQRFQETIASGEWDLVCYGHTHVAEQHLVGKTLVLNPGAIYRGKPHSIATVELPSLQVTIHPLD
ncbi:MAG: YfcE family phosphodiesterase [Planctomycetaceae bacterium]